MLVGNDRIAGDAPLPARQTGATEAAASAANCGVARGFVRMCFAAAVVYDTSLLAGFSSAFRRDRQGTGVSCMLRSSCHRHHRRRSRSWNIAETTDRVAPGTRYWEVRHAREHKGGCTPAL